MKTAKTFLLFSLLLGIIIIPACLPPCGEGYDPLPYFDIQEMNSWPYKEAPFREALEEGDSVLLSQFGGIELHFEVEYVADLPFDSKPAFHLPFISSAYACSLVPHGYSGSKEERLSKIEISTLNDWGNTFPAGSVVNELFTVIENDSSYLVDQFLDLSTNNLKTEYMFLGLDKDRLPAGPQELNLSIKIGFTNGEEYQSKVKKVFLR